MADTGKLIQSRAIEALNAGNVQLAANLFQEILISEPANLDALSAMMMIYYSMGEFNKCQLFIIRLKAMHPGHPAAYNTSGMICFRNQLYAEAVEEFFQAISHDEKNPEYYYNLSLALIKLGKINDAVFYLIRNISFNPFDTASKELLITLYDQAFKQRYTEFPHRNEFSVIINFSSLDESFIDPCIDNVAGVANKVVVIGFNKLFDGQDDLRGMQQIIERNKHKNVEFVVKDLPPKTFESNAVYHNITRVFGFEYVKDTAPYVLFIDGDEVAERLLLEQWRASFGGTTKCTRFYNYWYFREPIYRSDMLEGSPVLLDTNFLRFLLEINYTDIYRQPFDRNFYEFSTEKVSPPIFHHFSWVRTKQQMLDKVKNWGHKTDRDWTRLVEEEFQHEFTGRDFVHNYTYTKVPNIFNIHLPKD